MSQKEQRITIAITITVVVVALASLLVSVERKHEADREMAQVQKEIHERQTKQKAEQPEVVKLTPAELNAKRDAELEESRRKSEESKRHLEETLVARQAEQQALEEQRAAREAERAARRLTISEFKSDFESRMTRLANAFGVYGTAAMGTGSQRGNTITYPMAEGGQMELIVATVGDGVTGATLRTTIQDPNIFAGSLLVYDLLIQTFSDTTDPDVVYGGLGLGETIVDDLQNSRTIRSDGYKFTKQLSGKFLQLGIAED